MDQVFFKIDDLVCVSPIIFIFLASIIPISLKVLGNNREKNPTASVLYSSIGLLAAMVVSVVLFSLNRTEPYFAFSRALVFDGLSIFSILLISLIALFTALLSRESKATNSAQFSEFLFLLLNSAAGMMVLTWSNDLIVTFIGIEMMSLCLYLLIALSNEEKLSKEAAFKYFILGSFASAIFLYGIAFIYGTTGTTYIDRVVGLAPTLIGSNKLFLAGTVMAILGLCFKVALVPFHAWTPDVYEGAPTTVTGFMATGVKAATFIAFLRVLSGSYLDAETTGKLVDVLQWLAAITIIVGNVGALVQNSLKRMLAYSSIAHSGYIMIGLIAASVGGQGWLGASGVIFYMVSYTVMTLGAFAFISLLEKRDDEIVLVEELRGLANRRPFVAALFSIFLLSLAGIPPTVGFFGKFFLFSAAVSQGYLWLAIWGAIGSIISVYYYLRPIVLMYMKEENGVVPALHFRWSYGVVTLMAGLTIVFGLATEPIYKMIMRTLETFF